MKSFIMEHPAVLIWIGGVLQNTAMIWDGVVRHSTVSIVTNGVLAVVFCGLIGWEYYTWNKERKEIKDER